MVIVDDEQKEEQEATWIFKMNNDEKERKPINRNEDGRLCAN